MILLEDLAALLGLVFAFVAVSLTLITENLYFDVAGTALIGVLLLVVVAITLAIETKSLLLGEAASPEAQEPDRGRARAARDGIDDVIHMKTLHLGPEELLVAAKIGVVRRQPAVRRSPAAIDAGRAGDPGGRADRPGRSTSSPTSTAPTTCPPSVPRHPPPRGH